VITVPGKHVTMLNPGLVDALARELESCLRASCDSADERCKL
jgi:hypothetical protein